MLPHKKTAHFLKKEIMLGITNIHTSANFTILFLFKQKNKNSGFTYFTRDVKFSENTYYYPPSSYNHRTASA